MRTRPHLGRTTYLAAAGVIVVAAALFFASGVLQGPRSPQPPGVRAAGALQLTPCERQAIVARCGRLVLPENRVRPAGRKIALDVVVVPARHQPARPDAFVYVTGGPGGAATDETWAVASTFRAINRDRDILLVDARGTGRSHPLTCARPATEPRTDTEVRRYVQGCVRSLHSDVAQYGTRQAMDDLDDVRAALGYAQLDVYGISYGATAAQVYLRRYPASVRTLVLDGATAIDLPILDRMPAAAQHALGGVARRCAADAPCRAAFPHWRNRFTALVRAWDEQPVHNRSGETTTGAGLAGLVQALLLDANSAATIPLLVSRAAHGDYRPLNRAVDAVRGTDTRGPLYWLIWCNEPWVGLDAEGPWHTDFDSASATALAAFRRVCAFVPKHAEPAAAWRFPHGRVPVLVLAGGEDPQDPVTNLPRLRQALPENRAIVVPYQGHGVGRLGCIPRVIGEFVAHATPTGLDASCVRALHPPPFALR